MRKKKTIAAIFFTADLMMAMLTGCSQNMQTGEADNKNNIEVSANDTANLSTIGNGIDNTDTETTVSTQETTLIEEEATSSVINTENASEEESAEISSEGETETQTDKETGTENREETEKEAEEETEEDSDTPVEDTQPIATEETTEETTKETTVKETTRKPVYTTEDTNNETTKQPETTRETEKETEKETAPYPKSISATVSGNHYIGDTLDASDFNVKVTMSNGTVIVNPSGFAAAPLKLTGTANTITVIYKDLSTTVTVNASERPVETTTQPQTEPTSEAVPTTTVEPSTEQPVDTTEYIYFNEGIIDDLGRTAFNIQNTFRTEAGVSELKWSNDLYAIACIRAKELVADYSHRGAITSGENAHRYVFGTDKIEADLYEDRITRTATGFMTDWKNSFGHNKTLTAAHYEYGAIACYKYDGSVFCIAVFSRYDGFGEYEDEDCIVDDVIYKNIQNGNLRLNASSEYIMGEPVSVFKIDYVKLFWFPKEIPNVPGLFENMTYGDYCRSIGKYQ